jgi:hypothetical protein
MMERQARWSGLVMGVGSHMIAGARACSTFTTDYSPRPTLKTNRHYAEALLTTGCNAIVSWIWMVRGEGNGTTER